MGTWRTQGSRGRIPNAFVVRIGYFGFRFG
jgi:hypothetical protein